MLKKNYLKILIMLILPLTVAGCVISNPKAVDKKVEVINKIGDIKNNLASEATLSDKSVQDNQTTERSVSSTLVNQSRKLSDEFSQALIKTNFGDIKIKFYIDEATATVNNFMDLAKKDFYNNTKFHRVIKDFMIQGGDPNSKDDDWSDDGQGGPDYQFQDEINQHKLIKGSLAMANSGSNTNGSQFFIVTAEVTPWLDGKHTNFGYVTDGIDVVEKIEQVKVNENDHPIEDIIIQNIKLIK
ncbi:MAG: peptidylprolyl isomerase [Patescibacteria group bacterium]